MICDNCESNTFLACVGCKKKCTQPLWYYGSRPGTCYAFRNQSSAHCMYRCRFLLPNVHVFGPQDRTPSSVSATQLHSSSCTCVLRRPARGTCRCGWRRVNISIVDERPPSFCEGMYTPTACVCSTSICLFGRRHWGGQA